MKRTVLLACCLCAYGNVQAGLRVPAYTAYLDPNPDGAEVSAEGGISGWNDPAIHVLWYGNLKVAGQLDCTLELRLPTGTQSKLRLRVGDQSHDISVTNTGDQVVTANFGSFDVPVAGYEKFTLTSLNAANQPAGDPQTLVLDGPAADGAHFNLNPRRNAASVHLAYPTPGYTNVNAFYCEITAVDAPLWTYFEACGWHRGYFGMQVNSATERRIIFSVWDSGKEAVDRSRVQAENRVTLVAKSPTVESGDFGNEGTGGHSHLIYNWQTGTKQRFLVTARPTDATHTIYTGYWFHPEQQKWMLISSWKAPQDGSYLRGLYSFNENFGGSNGQLRRKALFGNQWFRTADGQWHEETTARFSHDPTGQADRLDRFMGVEDGQFFLSNGGFIPGFTKYGELFTRPATGSPPTDLNEPLFSQRQPPTDGL
jgi:hypothetical protein